MKVSVTRADRLDGTIRPPSDKSLTHRAALFAALASNGASTIRDPLLGEDCVRTLHILEQLGAEITTDSEGRRITVSPIKSWRQPTSPLDCGNSGTTMRLLAGVLASREGLLFELIGDESLSRRPMGRIVEPLEMMGAEIFGERPPVTIRGAHLKGVDYQSPVASAQIKSCVLLAGLNAEGTTRVAEPSQSRDHTERMLTSLGVEIESCGENAVGVRGGQTWSGFEFAVPADISSAAFFLCAAALVSGSRVVSLEVGTNPTRTGVLEVLASAGMKMNVEPRPDQMGEPVSHIEALHSGQLEAFEIAGPLVPRLIDEIPMLAVLATQCEGTTRIRDARELRVKETDRIEVVAKNLQAMGASLSTYEDGLDIHGPTPLFGTEIDASGDHRIGMAFAVAGLVSEGTTTILNAESIQTSYPDFFTDLGRLSGRTTLA